MSLLSYKDLVELVNLGAITNVTDDMINSSSIDLTLGEDILVEDYNNGGAILELRKRDRMFATKIEMDDYGFILDPGEFILAHTQQVFNLPRHISAEYKLKSSMARIGLEHLNAGWCDAGWYGSVLTLELKNMTRGHSIKVRPGDKIGQIVFYQHEPVPENKSYAARGRYNNDTTVKGIKE